MKFKRVFLLVLDSLGVGESIDANNYGDDGANTLKHIMDKLRKQNDGPIYVIEKQKGNINKMKTSFFENMKLINL